MGQHCLVSFASLLTGLVELATRNQSPICSRSSHWRNSPLKPPLSATSSRIRDVEFDLQNLSIIEQHDLFTKSFTRDKRPATNWSASLASTGGREFAQSGNYSQGIRLIGTAQRIRRIAKSQSPIRNNSSQCRNSPLKPMLSATRNIEITQRPIALPLFAAHSHAHRNSRRER